MASTRPSAANSKTYRLKVTLRGSRPPIWRRLEVDAGVTLAQLHDILQIAMGWTDSHLHQLRHGTKYYGPPDPEMGMERYDERRVHLCQVLRRPKDRMVYEYDFGDGWEHDVVLEVVGEVGGGKSSTRVLAGKGACPPEDVGGIGGYYQFLEAIHNPKHPEHLDMLEWGDPVDPDAFEIDEINKYFEKRSRKRRDA